MLPGQRFEKADATIREGKTSPPKHYTEDSLLAAMETAGAEDMPEDAERKLSLIHISHLSVFMRTGLNLCPLAA